MAERMRRLPKFSKCVNNLAFPTGIELETAKNADEAEQFEVIDISKLKKVGE